MTETKEGKITRVIFNNSSNGYTVANFETADEMFTITGSFHVVNSGARYRITGEFRTHKKYGEQFEVKSYEEILPEGEEGIRVFLASDNIRGIGKKTADLIVDAFGEKSLDVIENDPGQLLKIKGIGKKTLENIVESYKETQDFAHVYRDLSDLGIDLPQAVKIYKLYGSEALSIIKENPYQLADDIYGISFKKADEIGVRLGIDENSPFRIRSGIKYVLADFAGNGSTYMSKDQLKLKTIDLLDTTGDQVDECLGAMAFEGEIQTDTVDGTPAIYLYNYYMAEQETAHNLKRLMDATVDAIPANIENLINAAESGEQIQLSPEQRKGVRLAIESNVSIITGGPGTGKTTMINTIIKILDDLGIKAAIAAPTGRAAKRITETSGVPAKTIHRLLEYVYSEDEDEMQFGRDYENPIEERAVIIDEASMIDLLLMDALLKAIKSGSRLIMVGDVDQLPPVGAGNVLRDMIQSEYIPTVRLKKIFRQANESLIVVNAHRINDGEYPYTNEKDKDFFMMHRNSEEEILETVEELVSGRLEAYYDFIDSPGDIQVLTPTRKGLLGTASLNARLQAALNPPAEDKEEMKARSRLFREGDKVMQTKNNYSLEWRSNVDFQTGKGVFNGDMGTVTSIDKAADTVTVQFDDRFVVYDSMDLEELDLAYAITVHKAQGSEFPAVVMPMNWCPPLLQTRDLLYTAVTRGKKLVVLVGFQRCVQRMVDNDRVHSRNSGLEFRLREMEAMGGGDPFAAFR